MAGGEQHGSGFLAMPIAKGVAWHALIVVLAAALAPAQKPRMTYKGGPVSMVPTTPDDRVVVDGSATASGGETKTCSIQPFPGIPNTVTATDLQIPEKAQNEYEQACTALKKQQLPEAERHLRKATKIYPKYVAGWVMLGQMLETRQRAAEAREACSRAASVDPNYVGAYLCLAEIAGREQQWREVLKLTERALEVGPENDAYAYFFSAIAYFNLNQLKEAESRALKAETMESYHQEPLLQLLLAQICEAKHDTAGKVSHLGKYRDLTRDARVDAPTLTSQMTRR